MIVQISGKMTLISMICLHVHIYRKFKTVHVNTEKENRKQNGFVLALKSEKFISD